MASLPLDRREKVGNGFSLLEFSKFYQLLYFDH